MDPKPLCKAYDLLTPQWFCLVLLTNLDQFWGNKVPTEGTFCGTATTKTKIVLSTHYLIMIIGGVQEDVEGDQLNLKSETKVIS